MIVNSILCWLLVGSLIWTFLDWAGIVSNGYRERVARGERATTGGLVLATMSVIVGWPIFIALWVRDMRRSSR